MRVKNQQGIRIAFNRHSSPKEFPGGTEI